MLTPGEILRRRRQTLRKSLSQVSLETKIQEKYLKLLESEEYSQFDSNVFISGFIKIYSEYLGLDVDKMLALYRRSDKALKEPSIQHRKRRFTKFDWKRIVTPINTVILIMIVGLTIFILSTVNKYNEIQKKPTISIESPENNYETDLKKINLEGKTDIDSAVEVNGKRVKVDNKGDFSYEISLSMGENIITIKASSPETDLVTIKTIRIYQISKTVDVKEKDVITVEPKKYVSHVTVESDAAWIQLTIDGQQKIAQIMQPSKSETFPIKQNLELITGKPSITKLYINDTLVNLNVSASSGTASVVCIIENNELDCR